MTPIDVLIAVGGALIAYLIGSIPCGFLAVKVLAGVDIREQGSGNIGATNVGRFFGGVRGVLVFLVVFLLDVGKGVAAAAGLAAGARALAGLDDPARLAGIAYGLLAIVGHAFPVTLRFRGGKAVATSCGVMLSLAPVATAIAAGVWLLVAATTRYVSLASMMAALGLLGAHLGIVDGPWGREHLPLTVMMLLVAALVIVRHHGNIRRLIAGTERRLGRPCPKGPGNAERS